MPAAEPRIIEAQLERVGKTVTGLNAPTSSALPLLPSFNILSTLLLSCLPIYDSVRYSRSLSGRAFIFFQPLPRVASLARGLCQGLGGKRVGLAIIPTEAQGTLRIE